MSAREGQRRLREISRLLEAGTALPEADRAFLSTALSRIADGEDAAAELGVKAKRGERKGKHTDDREKLKRLALLWIATAKLPIAAGGLGLTLEAACAKIGENGLKAFSLTEETLRAYWNRKDANREPISRIKN